MNPIVSNVRLILAYIGTGFHGWQSQPDGTGIQDHLEKALRVILRRDIRVTASSRTDTGVHAEYQVVRFQVAEDIELPKLVKSLNAILPLAVRVRSADLVAEDFHPILSATAKAYRYRIWRAVGEHPFITPHTWHWTQPLNVPAMQTAAQLFCGTLDFTSFCASDSSAKTKVRTIHTVQLVECGPLLEIWFLGEGFLKQMVRTMVGTLVSVGMGKDSPETISTMLAAKDRRVAPATAPAQGLCLVQVFYSAVPSLDALLADAQKGYNLSLSGNWTGV